MANSISVAGGDIDTIRWGWLASSTLPAGVSMVTGKLAAWPSGAAPPDVDASCPQPAASRAGTSSRGTRSFLTHPPFGRRMRGSCEPEAQPALPPRTELAATEAGDLARPRREGRGLTVAGQRRVRTGLRWSPWHPAEAPGAPSICQASPLPDPYCWAMRAETRPDRAATLAALLRVVAAGACWALAAVLAKVAFDRGVPPVRLAEARVAVALLAMAPFLAWWRPGLLRPPPGTWPALAGFGVSVAAVNLTYYVAIDHLPVGVALSLQYTGPAILMAATALLVREGTTRPGRLAWAAAGLTLAGAVLVSRALEGLGALDLPGLAAGLASAVLFAAYLLAAELAGRRG